MQNFKNIIFESATLVIYSRFTNLQLIFPHSFFVTNKSWQQKAFTTN